MDRVVEELDSYNRRMRQRITTIFSDQDLMQGVNMYFQLPPDQYQMWLLHHDLLLIKEVSLQKNIQSIYQDFPFVSGIDIALLDIDQVYVSTSRFKSGTKVAASDYQSPKSSIPISLYDASLSTVIGTLYVSIDTTEIDLIVKRDSQIPFSLKIHDSLDRQFYTNHVKDELKQRTISKQSHDLLVEVAVPKSYVMREAGKLIGLMFVASSFLIGLLLYLLRRVFHHYQVQVTDIVDTVQQIIEGDTAVRIKTENKQQEMHLISRQVNQMLDSLDKNIRDIYRLEIYQKEANMRALQSQINPHFLYNTLEFFRMYAVKNQMDELSDMIYEFSTLLRGSISQSDTTTIKEELDFCEKHSYICQIRYPKSIAYAYQIDKGCEDIVIPRFVIQPLVENYFAHGVDLMRKNNALSVKVLRHGNDMEILVRDNGKGMDKQTCDLYNNILESRTLRPSKDGVSIGIMNVHERLLLFFGEAYSMTLSSELGQGVRYFLKIKDIFLKGGENNVAESIDCG
ncbi:sensor histidine kinase [Streptococcus merionis]|uniref:sensor histidine kinase n=1 Tax=Streptococcus merionis TaxID=400065 RepID=UPI0026EF9DA2|nr:sensor histidine kinase [Streptococcus merionis]